MKGSLEDNYPEITSKVVKCTTNSNSSFKHTYLPSPSLYKLFIPGFTMAKHFFFSNLAEGALGHGLVFSYVQKKLLALFQMMIYP